MCSIRLFPLTAFRWQGVICDGCGVKIPRGVLMFLASNETLWCSRECFASKVENEVPELTESVR